MNVLRGFRRLELDFDPVNVTPQVSSYQAAVNYEIGLIAAKVDRPDRPARLVRRGARSRSFPASPARCSTARPPPQIVVAALAGFSRGSRSCCRRASSEPTVTRRDLAGARASAARALSAPVRLALGARRFVLTPSELAPMLQLPASDGRSLVLGGAAADAYFAKLEPHRRPTRLRRALRRLRRPGLGRPAAAGGRLDVPARRRPCSPRPSRRPNRVARLRRDTVDRRPDDRGGCGDGDHRPRLELRDGLRRRAEPDPQRRARRAPRSTAS